MITMHGVTDEDDCVDVMVLMMGDASSEFMSIEQRRRYVCASQSSVPNL